MLRKFSDKLRGSYGGIGHVRESGIASKFWNEDRRQPLSVILFDWMCLASQVWAEIDKSIINIRTRDVAKHLPASSLADIVAYIDNALVDGPPHSRAGADENPLTPDEELYITSCEGARTTLDEISRLVSNVTAARGSLGVAATVPPTNHKGRGAIINMLEIARGALTAEAGTYSHQGDYSYAWTAACETPAHVIATLWRRSVMRPFEGYEQLINTNARVRFPGDWPGYPEFYIAIREPLLVGPRVPTTMDPLLIAAGVKRVFTQKEIFGRVPRAVRPLELEYHGGIAWINNGPEEHEFKHELPAQVKDIAEILVDTRKSVESVACNGINRRAGDFFDEFNLYFNRVGLNTNLRPIFDVAQQHMMELHEQRRLAKEAASQSPAVAEEAPAAPAPGA